MIEIRKHPELAHDYQLLIDSQPIKGVFINSHYDKTLKGYSFTVRANGLDESERIASHRLSEIPSSVQEIILTYQFDWTDLPVNISIEQDSLKQFYEFEVSFISYVSWRGAYSLAEYFEELRQLVLEAQQPEIRVDSHFPHDIVITGIPQDKNIADEITRCSNILSQFNKEAKKRLAARLPGESVAMMFDFPDEVRVPCEQYLLYFAQFLKDLGVEVDTALTHDAGQVLFTVTPNDKQQALDKIRAALDVYLHLPSSPVTDAQQGEIAILRLNAELQNFQSKLSLARAEIQMKEAAIQLQQVTIAQLTGEVVIESLKDVTPKPKEKDKEELLGGTVSIIPIKGKGVEINLPELFRRLKRLLKEDE